MIKSSKPNFKVQHPYAYLIHSIVLGLVMLLTGIFSVGVYNFFTGVDKSTPSIETDASQSTAPFNLTWFNTWASANSNSTSFLYCWLGTPMDYGMVHTNSRNRLFNVSDDATYKYVNQQKTDDTGFATGYMALASGVHATGKYLMYGGKSSLTYSTTIKYYFAIPWSGGFDVYFGPSSVSTGLDSQPYIAYVNMSSPNAIDYTDVIKFDSSTSTRLEITTSNYSSNKKNSSYLFVRIEMTVPPSTETKSSYTNMYVKPIEANVTESSYTGLYDANAKIDARLYYGMNFGTDQPHGQSQAGLFDWNYMYNNLTNIHTVMTTDITQDDTESNNAGNELISCTKSSEVNHYWSAFSTNGSTGTDVAGKMYYAPDYSNVEQYSPGMNVRLGAKETSKAHTVNYYIGVPWDLGVDIYLEPDRITAEDYADTKYKVYWNMTSPIASTSVHSTEIQWASSGNGYAINLSNVSVSGRADPYLCFIRVESVTKVSTYSESRLRIYSMTAGSTSQSTSNRTTAYMTARAYYSYVSDPILPTYYDSAKTRSVGGNGSLSDPYEISNWNDMLFWSSVIDSIPTILLEDTNLWHPYFSIVTDFEIAEDYNSSEVVGYDAMTGTYNYIDCTHGSSGDGFYGGLYGTFYGCLFGNGHTIEISNGLYDSLFESITTRDGSSATEPSIVSNINFYLTDDNNNGPSGDSNPYYNGCTFAGGILADTISYCIIDNITVTSESGYVPDVYAPVSSGSTYSYFGMLVNNLSVESQIQYCVIDTNINVHIGAEICGENLTNLSTKGCFGVFAGWNGGGLGSEVIRSCVYTGTITIDNSIPSTSYSNAESIVSGIIGTGSHYIYNCFVNTNFVLTGSTLWDASYRTLHISGITASDNPSDCSVTAKGGTFITSLPSGQSSSYKSYLKFSPITDYNEYNNYYQGTLVASSYSSCVTTDTASTGATISDIVGQEKTGELIPAYAIGGTHELYTDYPSGAPVPSLLFKVRGRSAVSSNYTPVTPSSNVYTVSNAKQLNYISAMSMGSSTTVKLSADIDMAGYTWKPIHSGGTFILDGQGHTISNFFIDTTCKDVLEASDPSGNLNAICAGLIGSYTKFTVQNLTMQHTRILATELLSDKSSSWSGSYNTYAFGAIAGMATWTSSGSASNIYNCTIDDFYVNIEKLENYTINGISCTITNKMGIGAMVGRVCAYSSSYAVSLNITNGNVIKNCGDMVDDSSGGRGHIIGDTTVSNITLTISQLYSDGAPNDYAFVHNDQNLSSSNLSVSNVICMSVCDPTSSGNAPFLAPGNVMFADWFYNVANGVYSIHSSYTTLPDGKTFSQHYDAGNLMANGWGIYTYADAVAYGIENYIRFAVDGSGNDMCLCIYACEPNAIHYSITNPISAGYLSPLGVYPYAGRTVYTWSGDSITAGSGRESTSDSAHWLTGKGSYAFASEPLYLVNNSRSGYKTTHTINSSAIADSYYTAGGASFNTSLNAFNYHGTSAFSSTIAGYVSACNADYTKTIPIVPSFNLQNYYFYVAEYSHTSGNGGTISVTCTENSTARTVTKISTSATAEKLPGATNADAKYYLSLYEITGVTADNSATVTISYTAKVAYGSRSVDVATNISSLDTAYAWGSWGFYTSTTPAYVYKIGSTSPLNSVSVTNASTGGTTKSMSFKLSSTAVATNWNSASTSQQASAIRYANSSSVVATALPVYLPTYNYAQGITSTNSSTNYFPANKDITTYYRVKSANSVYYSFASSATSVTRGASSFSIDGSGSYTDRFVNFSNGSNCTIANVTARDGNSVSNVYLSTAVSSGTGYSATGASMTLASGASTSSISLPSTESTAPTAPTTPYKYMFAVKYTRTLYNITPTITENVDGSDGTYGKYSIPTGGITVNGTAVASGATSASLYYKYNTISFAWNTSFSTYAQYATAVFNGYTGYFTGDTSGLINSESSFSGTTAPTTNGFKMICTASPSFTFASVVDSAKTYTLTYSVFTINDIARAVTGRYSGTTLSTNSSGYYTVGNPIQWGVMMNSSTTTYKYALSADIDFHTYDYATAIGSTGLTGRKYAASTTARASIAGFNGANFVVSHLPRRSSVNVFAATSGTFENVMFHNMVTNLANLYSGTRALIGSVASGVTVQGVGFTTDVATTSAYATYYLNSDTTHYGALLVGALAGTVQKCFADLNVKATVASTNLCLVKYSAATAVQTNCYVNFTVLSGSTATATISGLAYGTAYAASLTNSYASVTDNAGTATSYAVQQGQNLTYSNLYHRSDGDTTSAYATGLTTASMKNAGSFTGFAFGSIWYMDTATTDNTYNSNYNQIDRGYPVLINSGISVATKATLVFKLNGTTLSTTSGTNHAKYSVTTNGDIYTVSADVGGSYTISSTTDWRTVASGTLTFTIKSSVATSGTNTFDYSSMSSSGGTLTVANATNANTTTGSSVTITSYPQAGATITINFTTPTLTMSNYASYIITHNANSTGNTWLAPYSEGNTAYTMKVFRTTATINIAQISQAHYLARIRKDSGTYSYVFDTDTGFYETSASQTGISFTASANTTLLARGASGSSSLSSTNNNYISLTISADTTLTFAYITKIILKNSGGLDSNVTLKMTASGTDYTVNGGTDGNTTTTFISTSSAVIPSFTITDTSSSKRLSKFSMYYTNASNGVLGEKVIYSGTNLPSGWTDFYSLSITPVLHATNTSTVTLTQTNGGTTSTYTSVSGLAYHPAYTTPPSGGTAIVFEMSGEDATFKLNVLVTFIGSASATTAFNGVSKLSASNSTTAEQSITGQTANSSKTYTFNVTCNASSTITISGLTADTATHLDVGSSMKEYVFGSYLARFGWSSSSTNNMLTLVSGGTNTYAVTVSADNTNVYLYFIQRVKNTVDLSAVFSGDYYSLPFNTSGGNLYPIPTLKVFNASTSTNEATKTGNYAWYGNLYIVYADITNSNYVLFNSIDLDISYTTVTYSGVTYNQNDMFDDPEGVDAKTTTTTGGVTITPQISLKMVTFTIYIQNPELQATTLAPYISFRTATNSGVYISTSSTSTSTGTWYRCATGSVYGTTTSGGTTTLLIASVSTETDSNGILKHTITTAYGTRFFAIRGDSFTSDSLPKILISIGYTSDMLLWTNTYNSTDKLGSSVLYYRESAIGNSDSSKTIIFTYAPYVTVSYGGYTTNYSAYAKENNLVGVTSTITSNKYYENSTVGADFEPSSTSTGTATYNLSSTSTTKHLQLVFTATVATGYTMLGWEVDGTMQSTAGASGGNLTSSGWSWQLSNDLKSLTVYINQAVYDRTKSTSFIVNFSFIPKVSETQTKSVTVTLMGQGTLEFVDKVGSTYGEIGSSSADEKLTLGNTAKTSKSVNTSDMVLYYYTNLYITITPLDGYEIQRLLVNGSVTTYSSSTAILTGTTSATSPSVTVEIVAKNSFVKGADATYNMDLNNNKSGILTPISVGTTPISGNKTLTVTTAKGYYARFFYINVTD